MRNCRLTAVAAPAALNAVTLHCTLRPRSPRVTVTTSACIGPTVRPGMPAGIGETMQMGEAGSM